jgi:hypothetical protein
MYFDQINVLYGAVADYCTPQACPTMNAPCNHQFHWSDEKGKKFKYSAAQYIDTVLTNSGKIVTDEQLFPTRIGHPFPANFEQLVKRIHRHLFQVMAHMYHAHYKELLHLKLNAYANSIYFHLYLFSKMFNLIDEKDLEIMDALNKQLIVKYVNSPNGLQMQQLLQQQQQPTTHQPVSASSSATTNSSSANNNTSSGSSSSGFSFFKKKLNFSIIP